MENQLKPLGVGGVVGKGFALFGTNFGKSILLGFIFAFILAIPDLFAVLGVVPINIQGMPYGPIYYLFMVIPLLVAPWLAGALFALLGSSAQQKKLSVGEALRCAGDRYFILLGSGILVILMMGVGFVLFIIPGIIVMIYCLATTPNIVLDGKKVLNSIGDSFRLIAGSWWHSFGVTALTVLITFACTVVILIIFIVCMALLTGAPAAPGESWGSFVFITVLQIVLKTFYLPIIFSIMTVLFFNLKARQAAVDAAIDKAIGTE